MESKPWFAKHGPGWRKIAHNIFHKYPQEIRWIVHVLPLHEYVDSSRGEAIRLRFAL